MSEPFDPKIFRADLGVTQKELAATFGVTEAKISEAERAEECPELYRYACQGLQHELDGKPLPGITRVPEPPAEEKVVINETSRGTPVIAKRRRLGRPKGAQVHGMKRDD